MAMCGAADRAAGGQSAVGALATGVGMAKAMAAPTIVAAAQISNSVR
jgi:hypothetical protein